MKILLVDDEAMIRSGLCARIHYLGFEDTQCLEAGSGAEALEILSRETVDAAIVDISMPGMDGLTFIAKARETGCRTEFILLSGYSEFSYAQRGIELGVRAYLNKPVSTEKLREVLNKVRSLTEDDATLHMERFRTCLREDDFDSARAELSILFTRHRLETLGTESFARLWRQTVALVIHEKGDSPARVAALRMTELPEDMETVCNAILDLCLTEAPVGEMPVGERMRLAAVYLRDHAAEDIPLNELATRFGMSAAYFSSRFRRETGETAIGYQVRMRVERAEALLRDTNRSISDIAAEVGYEDKSYFFRVFKRQTGMTPQQYRDAEDGTV